MQGWGVEGRWQTAHGQQRGWTGAGTCTQVVDRTEARTMHAHWWGCACRQRCAHTWAGTCVSADRRACSPKMRWNDDLPATVAQAAAPPSPVVPPWPAVAPVAPAAWPGCTVPLAALVVPPAASASCPAAALCRGERVQQGSACTRGGKQMGHPGPLRLSHHSPLAGVCALLLYLELLLQLHHSGLPGGDGLGGRGQLLGHGSQPAQGSVITGGLAGRWRRGQFLPVPTCAVHSPLSAR